MILLLYIFQWLLVVLFLTVFILLILWILTSLSNKAPLLELPKSVIDDIYKLAEVNEESVLYHLGSNEGILLFHISKIIPKATYIGLENRPIQLLSARLMRKIMNRPVSFVNQDFFQSDLSDATHVFIYLYPNVMDDMLTKFDRELKPGTKLISVSFKFTQKQPKAEFNLKRGKYKLARKLYVYEF